MPAILIHPPVLPQLRQHVRKVTRATAGVSGTATASITEADVVAGGKTIIITLTGDTWATAGPNFDAQRQTIINELTSDGVELAGWNEKVRDLEVVAAVVRTSDTVVTITLTASATYNITAQETITVTVPASALISPAMRIIALPTFTVDIVTAGWGHLLGQYRNRLVSVGV